MDLVGTKVIVLILLGIVKIGSGLLPVLLDKVLQVKKVKWLEKFMSGILCFGGGVLLATVFVHMIPEVRESFETAKKLETNGHDHEGHDHGYPYAELVVCAGFFLIYLIEAVVHKIFGLSHNHSHGPPPMTSVSPKNTTNDLENGIDNPVFSTEQDSKTQVCSPITSEDNHPDTSNTSVAFKYRCSPNKSNGGPRNVYNVSSATLTSYTSYNSDGDSLDTSLSLPAAVQVQNSKSKMSMISKEKKIMSSLRNFLIVLALSIHSVFEGMAVGLQLNNGDVWKLFVAISIHECAILFCIGTEMITMGTKKLQILFYMVTLALETPLGVIIGMIVTEYADGQSGVQTLVIGVLQGMAGGTLLYITFYEVIEKEKLTKFGMSGLMGCFFLILGFSVMAGLEAAGAHNHGAMASHGHSHGHSHIHMIQANAKTDKMHPLPNFLDKEHDHDHHDHDHHNHDHHDDDHHDHDHHDNGHLDNNELDEDIRKHAEHGKNDHGEHDKDEHHEGEHKHDDEHNENHEHDEHGDHNDDHNDEEHDNEDHDEHDGHDQDEHDHEHDEHDHDEHDHEHDEHEENDHKSTRAPN